MKDWKEAIHFLWMESGLGHLIIISVLFFGMIQCASETRNQGWCATDFDTGHMHCSS